MGKNATIGVTTSNFQAFSGAGTNYLVQTPSGVIYMVYIDQGQDVAFRKSVDGGVSWSVPVTVYSGTVTNLSVWYDRWSDIAAGLIHVAYSESNNHDCNYRTIDTESSDALSTPTVIFNGASVGATGSSVSIVRARGGNVYCRVCIDGGAEGGFFRLPNANVPNGAWDAARTINEALSTLDLIILQPGWAADNQDIFAIFWDVSANEISRQVYDDSANTWSETSISTGFTEPAAPANGYPAFACAVDIANSQTILVAWNATDASNADLKCWTITESAITAKTDVITNAGSNCALCSVTLDLRTGYWWVFYFGKSDGSENFTASSNPYYKVSKDSGSTWGAEALAGDGIPDAYNAMFACPRYYYGTRPPVVGFTGAGSPFAYKMSIDVELPRSNFQAGM